MNKTVILTGITGQIASYLAEIFLENGYEVWGIKRSASTLNTERVDHLYDNPKFHLVYGDLADYSSIASLVSEVQPYIFVNLGALSHVRVSFDLPEYAMNITGNGVIRCLEALRKHSCYTRFVQMSSSEIFGSTPPPQNEKSEFHPRSPYAVAKLAGYWATVNYREAYGMFAANAINFNSESPRRGETFLTRKITRGATRIKLGVQDKLYLGNLESGRDWLHAHDAASAVAMIANAKTPDDFVIATGVMRSVIDFLDIVFDKLELNWKDYVEFDERLLRAAEVDALQGDSTKIRKELGWKPQISFEQLVDEMIENDMKLAMLESK